MIIAQVVAALRRISTDRAPQQKALLVDDAPNESDQYGDGHEYGTDWSYDADYWHHQELYLRS